MAIRCNRKGGYGIKIEDGEGRLVRRKLTYGVNDIDPELVAGALRRMDPKMAEAMTSEKPNGDRPDIELVGSFDDAPDGDGDGDGETKISAADKAKLVRAAETMEELRELAEGESRTTVTDAIDKRAAQLQAPDED